MQLQWRKRGLSRNTLPNSALSEGNRVMPLGSQLWGTARPVFLSTQTRLNILLKHLLLHCQWQLFEFFQAQPDMFNAIAEGTTLRAIARLLQTCNLNGGSSCPSSATAISCSLNFIRMLLSSMGFTSSEGILAGVVKLPPIFYALDDVGIESDAI
jgi:hypothetical protein